MPSQSVFLAIYKIKYRNTNFYNWLLLLLSGDIILNPWSSHNRQQLDHDEWNVLYLNVEGYIFSTLILTVCCQKLMNWYWNLWIEIRRLCAYTGDSSWWVWPLSWWQDKHGEWLLVFLGMILVMISNSISLIHTETCIFQRLLPNSKPVVIGIIAYLINQILGIFFMKTCLKLKRTFIVTSTLIWGRMDIVYSKNTLFLIRVFAFCAMFGLKHFISSPTQINFSSSSVIAHILVSSRE